jgi:hypothetical protein
LDDFPERVPFETLSRDMQNWLREMGYRDENDEQKTASAGNQ